MRRYSMIVMLTGCALLASAQPNRCSQETVVGTYALSTQGYVMMTPAGSSQPAAIPAAGLALVSIDPQGVVSGTAYQSFGGQVSQTPMPGTLKISSDCTGTVDWGGGVLGNLVVLGEGREIHSMMIAGAAGKPIISGRWKRISRTPNTVDANQCSANDVVGTYAIQRAGTFVTTMPGGSQPVPVPAAMMAVGSIDAEGVGSTSGIASIAGQTLRFSASNVKFETKADCTVRSSFDLTSQGASMGQAGGWGIVLDRGNEIWTIETQDPTGLPILLGTMKRLSPLPAK